MINFELIHSLLRKIFCLCPDCGEVFRLSNAEMSTDVKSEKDWLASLDSSIDRLGNAIERLEDKFRDKQRAITEVERKKVEKYTTKKIKRLIPSFSTIDFDSRDLKVIGHPVKFISFDWKDKDKAKSIRFIEFAPKSNAQEKIITTLETAIERGNYEWKTLRITDEGKIVEEE